MPERTHTDDGSAGTEATNHLNFGKVGHLFVSPIGSEQACVTDVQMRHGKARDASAQAAGWGGEATEKADGTVCLPAQHIHNITWRKLDPCADDCASVQSVDVSRAYVGGSSRDYARSSTTGKDSAQQ